MKLLNTTATSQKARCDEIIPHTVFIKSFCKNQVPHKSFNLFLILVIVNDKCTDPWGS